MVFLDEVGIIKPDAMILAAPAGDRILLGAAKAWQGLAGIEQAAVGALQLGHVAGGQGGDAGQGLHEVQGIALAGQQHPGRAVKAKQLLIGGEALAILNLPLHFDLAAELGKHLVDPGLTAEYAGLAGDDPRRRDAVGRDQLGGDIGAGIRLIQCGEGIAQVFE